MDNQTNKYSGFFKLFNPENLQVSFNVVGDTSAGFMDDFHSLVDDLLNRGYSIEPQDTERGEKIQEIHGWVLGSYNDRNTGKEENCVWLYGPDYLEYKVATIWLEDIPKLPFTIPPKTRVLDTAVDRAKAIQKKAFNNVSPPFKIVMEPKKSFDGTVQLSEKGNPLMRFSRIYGQPKSESSKTDNEEGSDGEDIDFYQGQLDTVEGFEDIGNVINPSTQAGKLIKWAKGKQKDGDEITSKVKLEFLSGVIDEITEEKGSASPILSVLSGVDTFTLEDELTASFVDSFLNLICDVILDDHGTPIGNNPKVKKERYTKAITDIHESVKTVLNNQEIPV